MWREREKHQDKSERNCEDQSKDKLLTDGTLVLFRYFVGNCASEEDDSIGQPEDENAALCHWPIADRRDKETNHNNRRDPYRNPSARQDRPGWCFRLC